MSGTRGLMSTRILLLLVITGVVSVGAIKFYSQKSSGTELEPNQPEAEIDIAEESGPKAMETKKQGVQSPATHQEPSCVRVEVLTLDRERVFAGEPVEATMILRNPAGSPSLYNLNLRVDGELHTSRDIELAGGEAKEINVTVIKVEQGRHTVKAGNASGFFEVIHASLVVTGLNVTPVRVAPLEPVKISATVENQNAVETTGKIRFYIKEDVYDREATVEPYGVQSLSFHVEREEPSSYYVIVGNHSQPFMVVAEGGHETSEGEHQPGQPQQAPHTPMYYVGDPLTDNFTSLLPPEASPLRLNLPADIEDIFFTWDSGVAGFGLHAGGHIEGLDHVWIEIRAGTPVRSWANGTVTNVRLSGDVEHGEYHITIDYGQNLAGTHMEIATPLVEIGDRVGRGQPVGYGMGFFPGLESAEFGLVDLGRTDGATAWGGGACVSPYDYLEEQERLSLVEAYKEHTVERYMKGKRTTWLFEPYQPYLTNRLFLHDFYPKRLTGEWYLNSTSTGPGDPGEILTIIEAENPYYTGNVVLSPYESVARGEPRAISGTFEVDYENGRIKILNDDGKVLFGIIEIDESGETATLRIEYQKYRYPDEFSADALVYFERTN